MGPQQRAEPLRREHDTCESKRPLGEGLTRPRPLSKHKGSRTASVADSMVKRPRAQSRTPVMVLEEDPRNACGKHLQRPAGLDITPVECPEVVDESREIALWSIHRWFHGSLPQREM